MPTEAIALDVHAHVIPLRHEDIAGLDGIAWTPQNLIRVDGQELPLRKLYDPDALVAWMDEQGIAQAWISVPPTLYRLQLDAAAAHEWAQAVNAALLRVAALHPARLSALLYLPVAHPEVAADMARAAIAAGHRRFAMAGGSAQRALVLSDAAYEPLWEVLSAAQAFLFLHPSRGCDPRLDPFYLQNLLGNPCENALSAAHLAMGGVLERHTGITFCLAHGGGAAAAAVGRLQRGQDTERPGAYLGGWKVREAFRRLCVDCIAHDRDTLELAARVHGADHVLFGSDWPFAMGIPEPHRQLAELEPALRQRIFQDNPRALVERLP